MTLWVGMLPAGTWGVGAEHVRPLHQLRTFNSVVLITSVNRKQPETWSVWITLKFQRCSCRHIAVVDMSTKGIIASQSWVDVPVVVRCWTLLFCVEYFPWSRYREVKCKVCKFLSARGHTSIFRVSYFTYLSLACLHWMVLRHSGPTDLQCLYCDAAWHLCECSNFLVTETTGGDGAGCAEWRRRRLLAGASVRHLTWSSFVSRRW
jgi:hypothetical protein